MIMSDSDSHIILDIHTHHPAPRPEAVVCVSPEEFNPIDGQIYSVGIHPWATTGEIPPLRWQQLEDAAMHKGVRAIGECGIDMVKGGALFLQMQLLKRHVELSEKLSKPLILHCVHAHDVIIGMKKDLRPTQKWLIHGFRGKPTVAAMLTDAGISVSFGSLLNDKSVGVVPEDMLFAETDDSETPIQDIIAKLSVLRGKDLTEVIIRNSKAFLFSQ